MELTQVALMNLVIFLLVSTTSQVPVKRASGACPVSAPCECFGPLTTKMAGEKTWEINCENKDLTSLPAFSNTEVNVAYIYLAGNKITTIPDNAFINIKNIQEIDLSRNQINTIGSQAFAGHESTLRNLYLQQNKLTTIPAFGSIFNKMEKLTLHTNGIKTLPSRALKNFPNLKEFHVQDCNMTSVEEEAFEGVENVIETIHLNNNFLNTDIISTLLDLPKLRILYLNNNDFGRGDFSNELDGPALESLQEFHIANTNIKSISASALSKFKQLRGLFMSKNRLQNMAIPDNENLKTTLKELYISDCGLTELPSGFEHLHGLQTLDISMNEMQHIQPCALQNNQQLQALDLRGNPLNCDCSLAWLRDAKYTVTGKNNICRLPEEFNIQLYAMKNFPVNDCDFTNPCQPLKIREETTIAPQTSTQHTTRAAKPLASGAQWTTTSTTTVAMVTTTISFLGLVF